MPHFIRTIWNGTAQFSIDWRWKPKDGLRRALGQVDADDVKEITEAEADTGISALRTKYFPESLPDHVEGYHGA